MSPHFVEYMNISVDRGFKNIGFSEKIIEELVSATLTANYGQDTTVHEFVGSVSVAGASSGLWAVHGGNSLVPQKLLEASKATLYKARVSRVTLLNESGEFTVESSPSHQDVESELNKSKYNIVIIAAPLTRDTRKGIQLSQFPVEFSFPGTYHRTVCTLVHGQLNHSHFGFSNQDDMADEILTTNLGMVFNSIGRVHPVDYNSAKSKNNSKIWKIFSQFPLSKEVIDSVFLETEEVNIIDWLAYPHYEAAKRTDKFVLYRHLYHLNAIEWAASAMEMSVIGAKNVALLAYSDWFNLKSSYTKQSHDEL
ncbi:prenylcysteine oxidase 1-like isoform X2 [Bacillus rossius redtenbacheri]